MKTALIILFAILILILIQQLLGKAWIGQQKKYSVGIYSGKTPLHIAPDADTDNPILTKFDVSDVHASFVADPFILKEQNSCYLFMEVKSKRKRDIGEIAFASGKDPRSLRYHQIVLREPFHLSFPAVYQISNNYYMIPESGADRSVRLYRADPFPTQWKLQTKLLEGKNFADPVLLFHDGYWWLFVSDEDEKSLLIYYSRHFDREYRLHPLAPFFVNEKNRYRNAGKILSFEGRLYRFVQDCSRFYGEKVDLYEITHLDPGHYDERFVKTLLRPSGRGWNATQMHHVDYLFEHDRWYAVVDGGSREKENYYAIQKLIRKVWR